MNRRLPLAVVLALLLLPPSARSQGSPPASPSSSGVTVVHNGSVPSQGIVTLKLEELWRVGENEDVLLGWIGDIARDSGGNFYLLDQQTAQVHVFSPDGRYLRSIGREGEGPGETQNPHALLMLPDSTLGILQTSPGKIVKLSREGVPAGDIVPGGSGAQGFSFLMCAGSRGGNLVAGREELRQTSDGFLRNRSLFSFKADGSQRACYLTRDFARAGIGFKWNEAADYFPFRGQYALGPDGRLYVAPERDRYTISVYLPDGRLERVIEREFEHRRRSAEEKLAVNGSMRMVINGQEIENEVDDYDPCINVLSVDDDNRLWVLHSRSADNLPPGVMVIYDVFDPQGNYERQVAVPCEGDPENDRLFLLGRDRVVLVRGSIDRLVARVGGGDAGGLTPDLAEAPLEVICYRIGE